MQQKRKNTAFFLLLGAIVGVLNGLLGAGGGVIAVLGLRHALRKTQHDPRMAFAGALLLTLPLSLLSLWRYAQADILPPLPQALPVAIPALLGGTLGALLLPYFPTAALGRLFGLLTLLSGVLLMVR